MISLYRSTLLLTEDARAPVERRALRHHVIDVSRSSGHPSWKIELCLRHSGQPEKKSRTPTVPRYPPSRMVRGTSPETRTVSRKLVIFPKDSAATRTTACLSGMSARPRPKRLVPPFLSSPISLQHVIPLCRSERPLPSPLLRQQRRRRPFQQPKISSAAMVHPFGGSTTDLAGLATMSMLSSSRPRKLMNLDALAVNPRKVGRTAANVR